MTPPPTPPSPRRILGRSSWPEAQRLADALRTETTGGAVLLVAALLAVAWANTPWGDTYVALRDLTVGPAAWHLDLTLGQWAGDGLLAVFFFVAGLELKREFVVGDLSDRAKAVLPVAAAASGVAVPALVYVAVTLLLGGGSAALPGWAVPTATDIAFALGVLAVVGSHLPLALRSFLLTLAVVDDLIAITIIAVGYTEHLDLLWLALAVVPGALFGVLVQRRSKHWWLLVPLALLVWGLVHASGVHATVAGVVLGMLVPVGTSGDSERAGDDTAYAERLEHLLRPFSAGFAVPVFAFMAAGVSIGGGGLAGALHDSAAWGVVAALVVGKTVGVFGGTWCFARFTRARLDDQLAWTDVFGLALLAGIGFTVSLLIGELAFGAGSARDEHVKLAVLAGSTLSAVLAAVVLRARGRVYRRINAAEQVDRDRDGIPDVYQGDDPRP